MITPASAEVLDALERHAKKWGQAFANIVL